MLSLKGIPDSSPRFGRQSCCFHTLINLNLNVALN